MSALNGDKSRFQRLRKAGLRRRERSRLAMTAMRLAALQVPAGSEETGPGGAPSSEHDLHLVRGARIADSSARLSAPGTPAA